MRYRGVVKELKRLDRGRGLIKTTCSRVRQLEITVSLYCLSKGLRVIYCSEKNPRSRIRRAESGSQVIRRGAVLLFQSYYLWEFRGFLCLIFFVILLLCNPNKIL